MTELTDVRSAADLLRHRSTGAVHEPGDAAYDALRLPWNRRIDPRPAVAVAADGPDDVAAAIRTARELGLPFAVQSTGHGIVRPADGGVLVHTGRMNVVEVDPRRRSVRVGPGAVWSDVLAAAAPYGLAPLSGTPSIGVAGYTLGGGTGWLSRRHGYAADSLLRADLVTADGERLTVSDDEYPELHWAIRGGSGNFGVATALELRLFPVGRVTTGMILYDARHAEPLLRRYGEWAAEEPDVLNTSVILMRMPDLPAVPSLVRGRPVVALRVFCDGTEAVARAALAPLLSVARPVLDGLAEQTFAEAVVSFGGSAHPPMPFRQHIDLVREVTPELVTVLVGSLEDPALSSVELRHWGGAMSRTDPQDGPVGHRDVPFSVLVTATGPDTGAVGTLAARLWPYATGGSFLNFLGDPLRTSSAYTADDWAALRAIKRVWDPDNVFRVNHNIPPQPR
jgi:FAD/FMN-containing dehydrogenase